MKNKIRFAAIIVMAIIICGLLQVPMETAFAAETNKPPIIPASTLYPSNGDTFAKGAAIVFTSQPADSDGTIAKVEYYRGSTLIGVSTNPLGYSVTWYNAAVGTYTISVVATDDAGSSTTVTYTLKVEDSSGKVIRQLYKDAFVGNYISHYSTGSNSYPVPASAEPYYDGNVSLKLKYGAENDFVNFRLTGSQFTVPYSKENWALQFWLYADTISPYFMQNLYVYTLIKNTSNVDVECRLPISKYLTSDECRKWIQVTIPFSDFYHCGTFYKGAVNAAVPALPSEFVWTNPSVEGAGFTGSTTGVQDTCIYVDDLKYVTYTPSGMTVENIEIVNNGGDNTVNSPDSKNCVTGNIKFVNDSGITKKPVVMLAFYEGNKLINYNLSNPDVPTGRPVIQPPQLLMTGKGEGNYKVKAFVWDSIQNMGPISESYLQQYAFVDNTRSVKKFEATVMSDTYQTIKGWGVSPGSGTPGMNFNAMTAAHDAIYNDLGITIARVGIRDGYGDADGNLIENSNLEYLCNYIKLGLDHGVNKYEITQWTPPNPLKVTDPVTNYTRLREDKETALCRYIVNLFNYLVSKGFPAPVAFSLNNEPANPTAMYYDTAQYKRVTKLLRTALDDAGYTDVKLLATEDVSYHQYMTQPNNIMGRDFAEMDNDPEFSAAFDAFCHHSYGSGDGTTNPTEIERYARNTARYPEKEKWQTEYSPFRIYGSEIYRTLWTMKVFASDMAWAGDNVWMYWWGYDPRYTIDREDQETLVFGDGVTTAIKSRIFHALSKIFKNVPVGSKVKRMTTNDPSLLNTPYDPQCDMVAFDTGSGTVAMLINDSKEDKVFDFHGLNGSTAEVYSIAESFNDIQRLTAGEVNEGRIQGVHIPASSVNIVITR